MGRPRNNSIDERALDDNAARASADTDLVECYPLPTIVQTVSDIQALNTQSSREFPPPTDSDGICDSLACHEPDATSSSSFTQSPGSPTASASNSTAEASRSSTVSPHPSIVPRSSPRPTRTSLAAASNHASTGSIPEWDAQQMSARSTLLYDTSPTMQTAEPNSPGSTVAHNRASLVSSSCSTIVSDSSIRLGRSRTRRTPLFSGEDALESAASRKADQDAVGPGGGKGAGVKRCNGANSSHSSILALYDNTAAAATNSQTSLVSPLAPPKLSLVLAEAIRARTRSGSLNTSAIAPAKCDKSEATPTLCSLCHSDFTIQGAQQHQCSSCLSLVCSFCLVSRSGGEIPRKESARLGGSNSRLNTAATTPSFARVLSMYIPSGYENALGDEVCKSCAEYSAGDKSCEMAEHQNQNQLQIQIQNQSQI
ncbi:hypothetical protein GGI23_007087 [Coemansia sp. RSA 2559]|nr:hypothetical protein GGI23_007087 [Coemansia sp. RSA 2559]